MHDLVIVGAGIAGMTAAIYGARSGRSVLLLEKRLCGGQITEAASVENYPGTGKISGAVLAENIRRQAQESGAVLRYDTAVRIAQPGVVVTHAAVYPARAVILANGVARRRLNVPGEAELTGRGVSYCAQCDGNFFRGKTVAVVGGGNTAVQEALYLSGLCGRVHLIHRRQTLSAQAKQTARLCLQENIVLHLQTQVSEICGDEQVRGIRLSGAESGLLAVDGVFAAVGLQPENALVQGLDVVGQDGYIHADDLGRTSVPWLFAAGDTREKSIRQLVTAAADGAAAAISAESYLQQN